jgi:hypothetical protein
MGARMSSNYDSKQGHSFVLTEFLHPEDEALLCTLFDEYQDHEEQEIIRIMHETKILKNVCLVKTLMYPYEYILSKIFLPKTMVRERIQFQALYWKFLRGKMTYEEFKDKLGLP